MKLSKITKGFAITGFLVGLLVLARGFWLDSRGMGQAASNWAENYEIFLCPPSFGLMGLETSGTPTGATLSLTSAILIAGIISTYNAILYGIVGGAISWLWRHARTIKQVSGN